MGVMADNSHGEESAGLAAGLTLEKARALALEGGFQEAGLVALPYEAGVRDAERFRAWVAAGRAGTMGYLEKKAEDGRLLREQTAVPFPWARSALVCFASYAFPSAPLSTKSSEPRNGWIARYAWSSKTNERGERLPSDYHKVLLKRIRAVEARLHEQFGEFESRAYVDTGPIVERALAAAAGLGWTGKNTCLIHPKLGSFGFLAAILTSLEVSESSPAQAKLGRGTRENAERRLGLGSGPMRELHTVHRCLPDGCIGRSLPDGRDAMHCLFDDRAQGSDRGRTRREDGTAGFWLRHLPGRLPVEWEGAAQRADHRGRRAGAAAGVGESGA